MVSGQKAVSHQDWNNRDLPPEMGKRSNDLDQGPCVALCLCVERDLLGVFWVN